MIRYYGIIRESAQRASEAAERTTGSLIERTVEQEPAFTDRMLGRIEEAMEGYEIKGVRWKAKTLTDRAPGAQEKTYGADFIGVLEISLIDYHVNKGFLAQSKLIEPNEHMTPDEVGRMKEQCEKMLNLSPDSYLFLYSTTGIRVVPALSVVSGDSNNPYDYYSRSVSAFFEAHFESFVGDRKIGAPRIEVLEKLRAENNARRLLYLGATIG
jgi:hypothetical protein